MRDWSRSVEDPREQLRRVGNSMEDGGTGGGFFRALWAQFLDEAHGLTGIAAYDVAATEYRRIAKRWTEVANLLREAGDASLQSTLDEAAAIVSEMAVDEREAMVKLEEASR
jgi:hypothetical protein